MITYIRGTAVLLLLFAVGLVAPGYAVAQPPVPASGATLYETTENMSLKALASGHRKATSELLGFAVRGTPICPDNLLIAIGSSATYCTLNATGSDNISLATGLGNFGGTFTVVVQEVVDPATGQFTPDSPEVVIAKGKFTGKMDFSPAILGGVPLGSVVGKMSLNGGHRVPFTGIFRLPFLYAPLASFICGSAEAPLYLVDPTSFGIPPTFGVTCVGANEMAIGYPTVRFEISF